MIRTANLRLIAIAAPAMLLAACGGEAADAPTEAAPAGDVPAEIKERHDNFEAISDSFKVIRTQLEGDADMAAIEAAAVDINERAQRISGLFPEGTSVEAGYDTEALATIWEKPEEFEAATQKLIEESAKMVELAKAGDAAAVGEQVKALGGSCKNCHDSFRLDDD
ncbi:MAG: c-type cytochrome [Erythrobacter sp.]|uniref:c-type cytochrome n=1 Tax=Erythrobacter sp. TaxID=1042 RepID=UPI003A88EF37